MMTDYQEVRGKRGIGGKALVGMFWTFQVLMVVWLFSVLGATSETVQGAASDAEAAGAAIGAGIGMGVILFFWVAGTVILGVMLLLTRPSKTLKAVEKAVIALIVGAGAAAFASDDVAAQDAPSFDVKAYCKDVAKMAGGSYTLEKGCRQNERNARDWAQHTTVSAQIDRYCRDVARSTGGSYSLYKGCVMNERRARDSMD